MSEYRTLNLNLEEMEFLCEVISYYTQDLEDFEGRNADICAEVERRLGILKTQFRDNLIIKEQSKGAKKEDGK